MNFGNNLKTIRKENKMSQEALADKIGVTRQSVSKWETGEAYPEMSNIVALCKIFHCQINDLINDNIIDSDSFDEDTKKDIIKFKQNQQSNMKRLSKAIYIISNLCKYIVLIPSIFLLLMTIVFPFISSNIKINDEYIKIFDKKIEYQINNNVLTINGANHYIDTKTNIEEFIHKHDNTYFVISIEYILISMTVLSIMTVLFLHYLNKLYKNIYKNDTPFTIENEKIINRTILFFLLQFVLTKLTALIFSIITNIDLSIDFNIKDIISGLIVLSVIYLFKYGRMLQVDSKAKIYGDVED